MNLTKDCSSCHAPCCRHLPNLIHPELQEIRMPNGCCKHLSADNKCSIYDKRPFFCKCEHMYKEFYSTYDMTEEQYVDMRDEYCQRLIHDFPKDN